MEILRNQVLGIKNEIYDLYVHWLCYFSYSHNACQNPKNLPKFKLQFWLLTFLRFDLFKVKFKSNFQRIIYKSIVNGFYSWNTYSCRSYEKRDRWQKKKKLRLKRTSVCKLFTKKLLLTPKNWILIRKNVLVSVIYKFVRSLAKNQNCQPVKSEYWWENRRVGGGGGQKKFQKLFRGVPV